LNATPDPRAQCVGFQPHYGCDPNLERMLILAETVDAVIYPRTKQRAAGGHCRTASTTRATE